MQPDAERFRPRDAGQQRDPAMPEQAVSEQSPPAADDATQQQRSAPPQRAPQRGAPQYGAPQYGAPQYGAPQYGTPQYGIPHYGNLHGNPQHGAPRLGPQQPARPFGAAAQPRVGYAPPPPGTRFAPALQGQDAPLIHPAAAQVSNATPYGVPVYRTPVYAYAPHPQRGLSITALVLGLCSFLFAWTLVVVPVIGIVFGFIALRREPAGRALAVIGLIASLLGLLWVLLFYLLPLFAVLGTMVFAGRI